jgi:NADH-quinone oxidoreductase subunit N
MYLAIEFQSLVFYVLASFKRTSEFSTESGLKYFILGAFSSALLLFGSSVLYSLTGLTNFGDFSLFFAGSLNTTYTSDFGLVIGLVFISVSLLFKLSAAPFHMWSPDVYEGAPLPITALFSILPKLAILTLLLRFCLFSFYDFLPIWQKVFTFCSYLSILLGTLSAFSQKKWKRFIAYSSINHVGFFLVGLSTGELEGTFGVLFYLSIYIAGTFGFFFFLSAFKYYQYPVYTQVRYLKSLKSLSYFNPVLAGTLTVFLFSMAGIPPLAGFFAKFFILFSALQNNTYGLVIFSVLMSSIACFYYIRLVKTMYFDNTRLWMVTCPVDKTTSIFLGLFMFVTIFIFLDLELFSLFLTRMLLPFLG